MKIMIKYLLEKIGRYCFFISILVFMITYFWIRHLPPESKIDERLNSVPIQSETAFSPFSLKVKDVNYYVEPLYNYDLYGMVVSSNDNEVWYSRFRESDPLNTKDICVLYGKNLKESIFKKYSFKSEEFACIIKAKSEKIKKGDILLGEYISNNHLLSSRVSDAMVYKEARKAKIGDQIHIKGMLVKYSVIEDGEKVGGRETSITRSDTGNNACETVFLTDFDIIEESNPFIADVYGFAKAMIIISILIYFFSMLLPYQPYSSNFLSE